MRFEKSESKKAFSKNKNKYGIITTKNLFFIKMERHIDKSAHNPQKSPGIRIKIIIKANGSE